MNFKRSFVVECLTRGQIKTPVSLMKQTLDSLALRICDKWTFRQHLCSINWSAPYVHSAQIQRGQMQECISKECDELCKVLSLPHTVQECLIDNIKRIMNQLFKWIGMWKFVFEIPSDLTAGYWEPSDWRYGRLNERKIAELLILENRLSIFQSFRLSCTYCLEVLIPIFWDQLSLEEQDFLVSNEEHGFPYSKVVVTWSRLMKGQFESQHIFLSRLFFYGLCLSPLNNVPAVYSWSKLSDSMRLQLLKNITVEKGSDESDLGDGNSDGSVVDEDNDDDDRGSVVDEDNDDDDRESVVDEDNDEDDDGSVINEDNDDDGSDIDEGNDEDDDDDGSGDEDNDEDDRGSVIDEDNDDDHHHESNVTGDDDNERS